MFNSSKNGNNMGCFPLVSIVVPIYKVQDYIVECIESILNQTYKNTEVILVDDGSPDACPSICDEYDVKYDNVKVIHKENGGLVSGRKAGLLLAKGKYVSCVDSDDWIEPDFIERLVSAAEQTRAQIVAAGFSKDLGDTSLKYRNQIKPGVYDRKQIEDKVLPGLIYSDSNGPDIFSYLWNKLFLREWLIPYQMAVPNAVFLGEDAACVFPAVAESDSLVVIDYCGYHYQQRPDSMLKTIGSVNDHSRGLRAKRIDLKALRILHKYLQDKLRLTPKRFYLSLQAEKYVLYLLVSRTGGFIKQGDIIRSFLFGEKIRGKRVIIYGAGTMGQHTVSSIKTLGYCSLLHWVDEDYLTYQSHGYPVQNPNHIKDCTDFDYILIAMLDNSFSSKTKEELINQGIKEEQIICPDVGSINLRVLDDLLMQVSFA